MKKNTTRRRFVKSATLAGSLFSIVPRHVLGKGCVAPSDQITKAIVGVGGMGRNHIPQLYNDSNERLLAVCDVDSDHINTALGQSPAGTQGYQDFREVIARDDIDVIHVPTPPHWHGLITIAAANAGKDIWCEKPLTRTIGEGEAVVDACKRNGTILRINTWFRFKSNLYGLGRDSKFCKKLINSGVLGSPITCIIGINTGFDWKLDWPLTTGNYDQTPQSIPGSLDYDFWLGPRPWREYNSHHVHSTFRGYWDYEGGGLGDMGTHYLDPVQYILGKDNESPSEIIPDTDPQHPYIVKPWKRVTLKWKDGTTVILDGNGSLGDHYLEGSNGWLAKGGASNIDINSAVAAEPDPPAMITAFDQSVKTRQKFALNEVNGHRSCTLVNLSKLSVRLNRTLNFDSNTQRFINDDEANRMIHQPMRSPWSIGELGG